MTDAVGEAVLVSGELRELAGPEPAWPEERGTVFAPPGEAFPAGPRIVALIPVISRGVGERELDGLPAVRIVANYGVGVDNIDLEVARRRGIVITNTPDVLTDATADLTIALMLAAARRLREGLELVRSGEWTGWHPTQLLGTGLAGKVLGIVGAGRIGTAVARRAAAFGMKIRYWSRSAAPDLEREVSARRVDRLAGLLSEAHVVTLHVPLAPQTRHLLGAAALAAMRRDAILVNTARGEVVEQEALAAALREGRLAAAGLDVYDGEPQVPAALRELPNVFLLPHLGSATREARRAMWELAAGNVRAVLSGQPPLTPVE